MALQLGAHRNALLDAGASEAKACLAAKELASYENRFDGIERRLDQIDQKIDTRVDGLRNDMSAQFSELRGEMDVGRFAELAGRLNRTDWMMGTLIVLVLGVLGRLLFIHGA